MSLPKAHLLVQTRRYREAEQEFRRVLAQDPNSPHAHSMLALTLVGQAKGDAALREAHTAVHLAPAVGETHFILAVVYLSLRRVQDAHKSVREAIRLNPQNSRYYALLSEIYVKWKRWTDALQAADEGLRLFPENVDCLTTRALALINLKRTSQVGPTLDTALALEPENATLHAVQGWLHFDQKRYEQAFTSFGEALRLNPAIELAQEGIVEAMKARNPIYRTILNYYLWMSRLEGKTKWQILIGGYLGILFAGRILRETPLFIPLLAVYLTFVFLTWTADTLFDLLLRFDRFGRRALSRERTIASNWVALSILAGAGLFAAGVVIGRALQPALFEAALKVVVLILPISGIFQTNSPRDRMILAWYSLALLGLTLWGLAAALQGDTETEGVTRTLFLLGLIAYTWLANILVSTAKRPA